MQISCQSSTSKVIHQTRTIPRVSICLPASRQVVPHAHVPIIVLKDKSSYSYESDISISSINGITNAFLMSCYAHADRRVAPLVTIVKLWAEKADIKGARSHRLPGNHSNMRLGLQWILSSSNWHLPTDSVQSVQCPFPLVLRFEW